ncbi:hypothetical protein FRC00_001954, partial [Tulasnella sp. 408]
MAHSNTKQWQPLNSIKNDLKLLLDYLKYQHGDTKFYILVDFEYEYKDFTGVTRPLARLGLPTRNLILQTIQVAMKNGGSGLIY